MEWTDDQLLIILESACAADGGTYTSISDVLKQFVELTSYNLLDRLEEIFKQTELSLDSTWSDVAPQWHIWETPKPTNKKYLFGLTTWHE
jgi:hypothetical protein